MITKFFRIATPTFKSIIYSFSSVSKNKALNPSDYLLSRHIGPSASQTQEMLKVLQVDSVQQLVQQAIPATIRDATALEDNAIGEAISEHQFLDKMRQIIGKNKLHKCYIGSGYYPTITPSVILRNLLENPGWYTAYTPYQAEVSQGRLESLINYQTMVQQLTRLEYSNASLLDQGSAGGQALYMSYNIHQGKRRKIFIDQNVFVTTQAVIQTKAKFLHLQVIIGKYEQFLKSSNPNQYFGVVVQTPDSKGIIHDFTSFFKQIDDSKSQVIKVVASDLLALTLVKAPGHMGADICFGSAQRFGVPMGFGGPYSGFFSTRQQNVRKMPGRIIGRSIDAQNHLAYRMALQTRQQHIRREKATSNICTAQALLANIAAMYAIYHGPQGLKQIAERVNYAAHLAANIFEHYGFTLLANSKTTSNFFDTITIVDCDAGKLAADFEKRGVNINVINNKQISLSFNELTKNQDLLEINHILAEFTQQPEVNIASFNGVAPSFAVGLARTDAFMTQKIFNSIHSESQMMRYLRSLQEKDISLDRSMIPLGSCTMKLNAASEMIPLTWPGLNLHPFVPDNQAQGYIQIIEQLRSHLKSVTKFDQISFQPNSGASGEYAGLLTIAQYLKSNGQGHRNICLIPKSAHGTNPASAILAGFKVIVVDCEDGKVNMKDLKEKAEKHKDTLGVYMITFPSTAGKYEDTIQQMTDIIHKFGGQVYMDGANMNAQVGYTSPGFLGADVCHLNLHKTFAIPHGGGGPGMGPIGVKKHLAPYLPTHPFSEKLNKTSLGTLTASEYGSASILTISYAYICMLGKEGVRKSTAFAILNANYLMKRLQPYFKISYIEGNDRCSHEFIIDLHNIKKQTGVGEEDIAKRLMDYGFHAPTMSFPVPGTLMVEPTESEDKGELDRFAQAMIQIHKEIHTFPDLVKNAPYTAEYLMKPDWEHKFSRHQAAYPLEWVKKRGKYWPTVRRISNPYGDRNLICSCPEVSSFVE